MRSICFAAGLLTGLALTASAQTSAGWSTDSLYNPGGKVRRLSTGELVAWDGQVLSRQSADGVTQTVLHSFPAPDFSSIFAVDPTETFAILGRGNDEVFTADLTAGGVTPYTTFPFGGFDADFSADGWCAVSAPSSVGGQNGIFRCEFGPDSVTEIVRVSGPSGPLAFDPAGNLYYAPASNSFPTPPGSSDLISFSQADIAGLTGGAVLGISDAFNLAIGYDGISSIVVDQLTGRTYIGENNFGTGVNRVRLAIASPSSSPILFEGANGLNVSLQDFEPGTGGAVFDRFQPDFGGSLVFSNTNFFSVFDRLDLRPDRAELALTGPGTTGVGPFDLEVSGGLPSAVQLLMYGPASTTGPELALGQFTPPLFVGLDLGTLQFLPFNFVADGAGEIDFGLFNVTGTVGAIAIQMLLLDENGTALGTTAPAIL